MSKRSALRGRVGDSSVASGLLIALGIFAVGTIAVLAAYGGVAFWPVLLGGFGASLAAFVLALSWDREQESRRERNAADVRKADREREKRELEAELITEARRRLEPLREELRRDKVSVDFLATRLASGLPATGQLLHPELLDAAWHANAPRLTRILADYELVSKLATTYGRIEELRWRLRQRTAFMAGAQGLADAIDGMSKLLIDELVVEVGGALKSVAAQIKEPTIQVGIASFDQGVVVERSIIASAEG